VEKLKIEFFRKGLDFLNQIKSTDRVVLIYHNDVDGVSSADLMMYVMKKIGKEVPRTIVFKGVEWMRKLKNVIRRFDKIIILDVSSDLIEEKLFGENKKLLVIDHHPGRDLKSKNIVYINPRSENKKIYQPTSYLVYKMFTKILSDKKWVAKIGTVGDYGIRDCKDLIRIKNGKNIWKTKYGKASVVMNSSISVDGPESTLKYLLNSSSMEKFLKNKRIVLAFKKFEHELKRVEDEYKINGEISGKVIILVIESKYRSLGSTLSTKLGTKNPKKIVFVFEKLDGKYRVHGRCEGCEGVNIGDIFKKFGVGGGHEKSGAGTISERDFESFRRKLIDELKGI